MSLWLQSFGLDLDDCGEDLDKKAKCVLAYLSMPVPRSWWENAIKTGKIADSHISLLQDLQKRFLGLPRFSDWSDIGLLISLGFADDDIDDKELKFGMVDSSHRLEEYLFKAKEILTKHPELSKLINNS